VSRGASALFSSALLCQLRLRCGFQLDLHRATAIDGAIAFGILTTVRANDVMPVALLSKNSDLSNRLASWLRNSVDFEASTVKILRSPSTLENVKPFDCRSTFIGAAGGAPLFCTRATILCCTYTATVANASNSASVADQRA
jgi:hypothetical protein